MFYNNDFFITLNNSKKTNIPLTEYLKKVADFGAGEIVLFDVESDGTMNGPSIKI